MKKRYNYRKPSRTNLRVNTTVEGEPIHIQLRRMIYNGEPVQAFSPIMAGFAGETDGVSPKTDIRRDRMDMLAESRDAIHSKIFDLKTRKQLESEAATAQNGGEAPAGESK